MKVFVVIQKYLDAEQSEHSAIDAIFATREFAQEYVDYEIGAREIEEHEAMEAPTNQTINTKKRVEEGRIIIRKKKYDGNVFLFPNQDK